MFALDLFGPIDFEYTVLNCYDMPAYGDSGMLQHREDMENASKEGLDAYIGKLNLKLTKKDYLLRPRSVRGQLGRVMQLRSSRTNSSLVVMGTQGASGVKEVFMGTNTADVIKHSRLPVLAVPEQARHNGSTRIVLADDGGWSGSNGGGDTGRYPSTDRLRSGRDAGGEREYECKDRWRDSIGSGHAKVCPIPRLT
ncbi:MAG: universal stress protein [Flavobacteriales bacterium]|nr:universal stress protein [Flavobacteriales bacterium]